MAGDDAGGGRRGRRAVPSAELMEAARAWYGLPLGAEAVDLGGSCNLNLLVRAGGDGYVLRVYRPCVGEARLADIQAARSLLAAGGVPCPLPRPARNGDGWMRHGDRLVEIEAHVDGGDEMDTWPNLEAALPVLGRIHSVLRPFQASPAGRRPPYGNHIQAADAWTMTLRGTRRMRSWGAGPEGRLAEATERLAAQLYDAERRAASRLPQQLVHGDFWDNNVLLKDGKVALVTDFDFMGARPRIDDLALTLYYACMEDRGGAASVRQPDRLRGLVQAYDRGLDRPLSPEERAALPLALARQPLWSIGGWVALLDDEEAARDHAAGMGPALDWALGITREIARWRDAFRER